MRARRKAIVGTRGSALALRQTESVVIALRRSWPDLDVTIETIRTTADRFPDREFERLPGIGFFVKELETALLERRIDLAVHSMKDLPADSVSGLRIAAVPEREDPRDVLVSRNGIGLRTLAGGARVGTSSPRRAAFLRAARPDLTVVPVRGNVETRLRKVDAGEMDAVCLAYAGLHRIGLAARVSEILPIDVMLPAPGQGALGVQVRDGDDSAALAAALDHPPSRAAVDAERAMLHRLQGGCRLPVGANASIDGSTLTLRGAVVAPDGRAVLAGSRSGPPELGVQLGGELAGELLDRGAEAMLPVEGAAR
jgi:hydroxymethylbilane synthase